MTYSEICGMVEQMYNQLVIYSKEYPTEVSSEAVEKAKELLDMMWI